MSNPEIRQVALNKTNTLVVNPIITPIYPVRYAYVNLFGDHIEVADAPPPLASMLNQSEAKATQGYAARLLRPGWIYIREENGPGGGHFQIFKYVREVHNNQLVERFPKYQFANGHNAQGGLREDTSGKPGGYPFVFVRKEVTQISIAYSEHEWHPDVIDRMHQDAAERAEAMQRINLQAEGDATALATAENFTQLVEDYREQQQRLLYLKTSETDASIKDVALDLLTTQASYEMNADYIAAELRQRAPYQKVAKIVALHDPVGRQRDIAEIHAKLALWEKGEASQQLYPLTIGQFIEQFKQSTDESFQKVLKESINWEEYNQYWQKTNAEFALFRDRQQHLVQLYQSFMHGSDFSGQVGSLDTYFRKFFCTEPANQQEAEAELIKLCDIASGIFSGILSTEPGTEAIEALINDYENDNNTYNSLFEVLTKIVTSPQQNLDWSLATSHAVDGILSSLGGVWGKLVSFSIYEHELATRQSHRITANALKHTVNKFIPAIHQVLGISIDSQNRARYTTDELGKILARHLKRATAAYPGTASTADFKRAEGFLELGQKLFNWGETTKASTIPHYVELSNVKVSRIANSRYSFVVPKSVGEGVGIITEGGFAGISAYLNLITLYELLNQSKIERKNPLDNGNLLHDLLQLCSAATALIVDGLAIGRAGVGTTALVSSRVSNQAIAALAPKLAHRASALHNLLNTTTVSRLIVAANLAAALSSLWDGVNSWQHHNKGEAAGHFALATGSLVFAAGVLVASGSAALTVGGGAVSSIVAAIPGLIVAGVGFLFVGTGATLLWIYGKPGIQLLLENCFWGNGKVYAFLRSDRKRDPLERRLNDALRIHQNENIATAFKIETQEFINYLHQPSLSMDSTEGLLDFSGDERMYHFEFKLPNFQPGVSDIHYSVYTRHIDQNIIQQGLWRANPQLTEQFRKALPQAQLTEADGISQLTMKFPVQEDIELHWYYEPKPGTIAPLRYLTSDGLIKQPLMGMINEDLA